MMAWRQSGVSAKRGGRCQREALLLFRITSLTSRPGDGRVAALGPSAPRAGPRDRRACACKRAARAREASVQAASVQAASVQVRQAYRRKEPGCRSLSEREPARLWSLRALGSVRLGICARTDPRLMGDAGLRDLSAGGRICWFRARRSGHSHGSNNLVMSPGMKWSK